MEQEQQKWTDSVLSSFDGMQRAQMPTVLRDRLMQSVPGARKRIVVLRRQAMWAMAAGLALLIALNIYSLAGHSSTDSSPVTMQANPVANEYFAPAPSI